MWWIIGIIILILFAPGFFFGLLAIGAGLLIIGIWLLPIIFIAWLIHYIIMAIFFLKKEYNKE